MPNNTKANESSILAALERPGDAFLSGLQGCGHALGDGMSRGSECLVGWSVDYILLDALTRFATEQGQTVFGEHFRIVNNLSYSPYGSGLSGGLDVVVPLASSTTSGAAPSKSKAQLVNRMRHLVTAAARQARSLVPGARPTRWNQLR